MTKNLLQLKKDLKAFAKRCKDFKYTDSALFVFLLCGKLSSINLFSANVSNSEIKDQTHQINKSISQMRTDFKRAKAENNKLIKNTNLELIQLMEQGDQVVKDPFSNWQIGMNYFYDNWGTTYKGRGDKENNLVYQRDITLGKYDYQANSMLYGTTRLALNSNNTEKPVDIEVDASLRTVAVNKQAPTFTPTTPGGGLPPFEPLMVTPPVINPKNVNIAQVPTAPPTDVAFQNVPVDVYGYNLNNPGSNNALMSQLELLTGTYNNYFAGVGTPLKYNFTGASENAGYTPTAPLTYLPASDAGDSYNTAAFYALSGKALVTLPNAVTVNIVGNNGGGQLNSIYYMGNNTSAGTAESKLVHQANTNIYGNKIAVVNIDNVNSPGDITFVNSGNIIGYAQTGLFIDVGGSTLIGGTPRNHVFGAYSYGNAGVDTIENTAGGSVIFYAPESVGWAYSASAEQRIKRSSINNGKMKLFGKNSLGIATDNDTSITQMAYADIQLNTPIEIYGDESVGASFLTEPDATSNNFLNSKFNIQIGGSDLTAQDATYGDTKGDTSKVQNSVGLNFDFNIHNNGYLDKGIDNYFVDLKDNSKNSVAIRTGQAKLIFNDSAASGITIGGEDNVGYLSDGGTNNKLVYNNTTNNYKVSGKNTILFAATSGGTLEVKEGLVLSSTNVSGDGFSLAYSESANSNVTLDKGVTGEVTGKDAILYYAKNSGKITITEPTAVTQPSTTINSSGVTVVTDASLGTPKVTISGNNGVGYYATSGGEIINENSYTKLSNGLVGAFSDGSTSSIDLKNSILDYKGDGYSVYSKNNGKIDLSGTTVVLRGKAIGLQGSSLTDITTNTNTKIVVMSNDAIPFEFKNQGTVNLTTIDSDLGITSSGIQVINGEDGTTTYTDYKKAFVDGIANYNINTNIDKSLATNIANETTDSFKFAKRYLAQRAVLNLLAGNSVKAHLNTSDLTAIGAATVVGLDMSSSSSATSNNETQINLASGSTVSSDRTDSGNGAVGLYINYGKVNTDTSATINVEKEANTVNDSAVGIYAVNGSEINNQGTINVGGNSSIGLLGLTYREDSVTGAAKVNEFGGKSGEGTINITNKGNISLDGTTAYGIYVKNNNSTATATTTIGINASPGVLNLSGNNSIGMIADKGTLLNDTGAKINMTGQEQVGMYGKNTSSLTNNGEINLATSTTSVSSVGIYTDDINTSITNNGKINGGNNTYGIFGKVVTQNSTGEITVGDAGVGIYSTEGNITLNSGSKITVGGNEAVGVFTTGSAGRTIVGDADMTIGEGSFGYVLKNTGTTKLTTNSSPVTLKNNAKYIYSDNGDVTIINNLPLTSTGNNAYGIYSAGKIENNADINFGTGTGSVGIYAINGGTATNNSGAAITVSGSNTKTTPAEYGMGMATSNGTIINNGIIKVGLENGIGMFASGSGSKAINNGIIELSGKSTKGMYIDNNAVGENWGTIKTVPNSTNDGILGVVATNGGIIKNYGQIIVDGAANKAGYLGSTGNYSNEINTVTGIIGTVTNTNGADGVVRKTSNPTSKTVAGIEIDAPAGATVATIRINGTVVTPTVVNTDTVTPTPAYATITSPSGATTLVDLETTGLGKIPTNEQAGTVGMYIDTSGVNYTHPIQGLNNLSGLQKVNLIFGSEAARYTDSKVIEVGNNIISPYNNMILSLAASGNGTKYSLNAGSLTWFATATQDMTTSALGKVYLVKIPYQAFAAEGDEQTYTFLIGLEERYGVETDGREKEVFNKLNNLGKGEGHILAQAIDEMKGHQYSNIQQRMFETGNILNKEIDYLQNEWRNPSKNSNKIKVFGQRGEFKTDTAGVVDYTNDAYGVAYVHENEKIKLGNKSGWYAGSVYNKFKFKDIGKSEEEQTMVKVGIFKQKAFDHNGSLTWKISGEAFAGRGDMKRRYWVVDEVFEAKGKYTTYGAALKNEIGKEFRTSENISIKPYAALNLEYGRYSDFRETGPMALEVQGNDYFSAKSEAGISFNYKQNLGVRSKLTAGLTAAYENELGELYDVQNNARLKGTSASYYRLRGDKENRSGNGKFDLNLGWDNTRFGVTVNAGYDTTGENFRGGIGFRAIY